MFRKQEDLGECMTKRKAIACTNTFFQANGEETRNVILSQHVVSSVAVCLDYSLGSGRGAVLTGGMADD